MDMVHPKCGLKSRIIKITCSVHIWRATDQAEVCSGSSKWRIRKSLITYNQKGCVERTDAAPSSAVEEFNDLRQSVVPL